MGSSIRAEHKRFMTEKMGNAAADILSERRQTGMDASSLLNDFNAAVRRHHHG